MTQKNIKLRTFLGAKLQRNSGGPHFTLMNGDRPVAYTYIRKNACSSFKRFMLRDNAPSEDSDFAQMLALGHITSLQSFKEHPYRIFVYREPIERIISLFINKFAQQDGHSDIFKSYQRLTGEDPETATFDKFVFKYILPNKWRDLDPHLKPQLFHLAPATYTHAMPMTDIYANMREIIGPRLADKFFLKPVNVSKDKSEASLDASADLTAAEFNQTYRKSGVLPNPEVFANRPALNPLKRKYSMDVSMYDRLSVQ